MDYLSREAIIKELEEEIAYGDEFDEKDVLINKGLKIALKDIKRQPAADVQPVRHGRWIIADDVENFIAICSECGRTEDSRDIKDMPYCHCGARMDGEYE